MDRNWLRKVKCKEREEKERTRKEKERKQKLKNEKATREHEKKASLELTFSSASSIAENKGEEESIDGSSREEILPKKR